MIKGLVYIIVSDFPL